MNRGEKVFTRVHADEAKGADVSLMWSTRGGDWMLARQRRGFIKPERSGPFDLGFNGQD